MEPGPAFRPWHDKPSGRTGVKFTQGKCLHFYFYFVHERLRRHGLIKKIGHPYKYYVTNRGQRSLIAALKLKEHLVLPTLMPARVTA